MAFSQQPSESLPPDTTAQQDLTTAGQRRVNVIWEVTQAVIAIMVTVAALTVVCAVVFLPVAGQVSIAALVFVTNLGTLVLSTYFQRTNHSRIGGIGLKDYSSGGR